ncbi:hypothetical protein TNCV_109131 [Trichonephila clavipes]|nr:hypothetical protein TNCV_109131 [Trichonephila clavipes]
MTSLRSTGPNTSSQHNQSGLSDHPASIMPMILLLSNCDSCSYCLRKRRNGMSTSVPTFPSGSNDSSGIVNDNLHDSAESDLRVSLVDNGLVGPYSATVLVTPSSAPDHQVTECPRDLRVRS